MGEDICVVQVTNIAPNASHEQMKTFFSFLGEIDELAMYPEDEDNPGNQSKVCYVKYSDPTSVGVAQHLTNTVFIDRALIVQPHADNTIPDAETAQTLTSGVAFNGGSNSGLISQIVPGVGGAQVISTIDPRLTALGLPQYPPLPANTDPSRVEEIRRTIYVGNLDSKLTAEDVLTFFNQVGEVKYVRMAGDENQPTRFSFVEFTEQSSVANALQFNGTMLGGRPLKINHSNNAIVKPQPKAILPSPSLNLDPGIEETMKRVREAQSQITAQIDPLTLRLPEIEKDYRRRVSRSRSRSRGRRSTSRDRRRSRSRERRRRSRSRERRRSPRRSSRSPGRRRSRSPGRRRSRSRDRRRRSRSGSRERRRDRDRERSSRTEAASSGREYRRRSPTPEVYRRERSSRYEKRASPEGNRSDRDRGSRTESKKSHRRRSRSLSRSPRGTKKEDEDPVYRLGLPSSKEDGSPSASCTPSKKAKEEEPQVQSPPRLSPQHITPPSPKE